MTKVYVRNPYSEESLNKALSIFRKKVNRSGHLRLLKQRAKGHKKKSEIKHTKNLELLHKRKLEKRKKGKKY